MNVLLKIKTESLRGDGSVRDTEELEFRAKGVKAVLDKFHDETRDKRVIPTYGIMSLFLENPAIDEFTITTPLARVSADMGVEV